MTIAAIPIIGALRCGITGASFIAAPALASAANRLDWRRASFETPPLAAPQDDGFSLAIRVHGVILRA